jgi:hypothetical protein
MPSLTNKTGYTPVVQWPKCSKTRNEHEPGPQMAIDPHHRETMSSSGIQQIEGSRGGSCTQRGRGVGNRIRSNSNIKHKRKPTSLSVSQKERSTELYSLTRGPKAPDKRVRCPGKRYNAEVHNAPWPKGGDCGEQSLYQRDACAHQRSLCDSHHTSHDTMHKHIAEEGEMERAHPTHPTCQVHGPYWDQDSDDSSSPESGVGNEGPKWRAKKYTEQLSECSDELSEALSDTREPDEELNGPWAETVHMACIREIHHYQVDRDSDDGEPHPDYEDEIIPCNDAQERGQNCESPVERHWVESEVPDWIQDSDENSPKCEGEDDNEDEFEEESEAEEDPFVDKLELKVENW